MSTFLWTSVTEQYPRSWGNYSTAGSVDERSPFPDGQPHIRLTSTPQGSNIGGVTLHCRIVTGDDLVRVAEAVNIYRRHDVRVKLAIAYLMGGRMDRALSDTEPHTLKAVCDLLNSLDVVSVSAFVPHSQATSDLLRNYRTSERHACAEPAFYRRGVISCLAANNKIEEHWTGHYEPSEINKAGEFSLVFPDEGARKRYSKYAFTEWFARANFVTMVKDRNERTGQILDTYVSTGKPKPLCVIVDDLCDGGRTFIETAKTLRSLHGVESVNLVVAHGIFSKGTKLEGIDHIVTTNSFKDWEKHEGFDVRRLQELH